MGVGRKREFASTFSPMNKGFLAVHPSEWQSASLLIVATRVASDAAIPSKVATDLEDYSFRFLIIPVRI